jgi:hypothetical protein
MEPMVAGGAVAVIAVIAVGGMDAARTGSAPGDRVQPAAVVADALPGSRGRREYPRDRRCDTAEQQAEHHQPCNPNAGTAREHRAGFGQDQA